MRYKYDFSETQTASLFMVITSVLIIFDIFYAATLNIYIVFMLGIVLACIMLNRLYERNVMKHLHIDIINDEVRHYKGESGVLKIRIAQKGIMPVLSASLTVTAGNDIRFINDQALKIRQQTETTAVFTVLPKKETVIEIPYTAARRGVSYIVDSRIRIPRIFGFGHMDLRQVGPARHEIMIYPDKYAVHNEAIKFKIAQGLFKNNESLYNDPLLTLGNREYMEMDTFRDINWKQSARIGNLQSKIYEKTTYTEWLILINLRSESVFAPPGNIERIFEKLSFLTGEIAKEDITYSLIANMKTFDEGSYFRIDELNGLRSYRPVLEALAKIKTVTFTIAFERFLNHVRLYEKVPSHIIVTGETDELIDRELEYFLHRGITIYQLNDNGLERYGKSSGTVRAVGE
ncbi:hypothetical protein GCM10007275_20810 [Jeotgalicoccus coquinae]|uniref:Uncharacterized protein n=1 Tax=Jeotgalicoccus coquinae TaxID=709509 RepID=A0A6V7RR53_9STAP|nr:DUF58 domain-containing protein [Jeotgalicoccus coquinae]MBB6424215.1 hypothetical protein [Jeotgalicoccus coquinae]GGE25566.1 hypothetical protein GCM10007275_20810 [Jeotgalicoccus coquinae]CAD2081547.1 hypothetical protein JEOCOQ751_02006 [Jeotgalicoccus coquinae]